MLLNKETEKDNFQTDLLDGTFPNAHYNPSFGLFDLVSSPFCSRDKYSIDGNPSKNYSSTG